MKSLLVFIVLFGLSAAFSFDDINWKNVRHMENNIKGPHRSFTRKGHIESRITAGKLAVENQFPYQAGLLVVQKPSNPGEDNKVMLCGGSLIKEDYVLTAAHCFENALGTLVVLGQLNISKYTEPDAIKFIVNMTDIHVHPNYTDAGNGNDITIIKLPAKVVLTKSIQTISLAPSTLKQKDIQDKIAVASGWGMTADGGDVSVLLRYANLRIISAEYCKFYFVEAFGDKQICVDGSNHRSVCSGDSGGPLALKDEKTGENILIGLVSYGKSQGCEMGFPQVFTRINSYLDWIKSITGIEIK